MHKTDKAAYECPFAEPIEVRMEANIMSVEGGVIKPFGAPKKRGFEDEEDEL